MVEQTEDGRFRPFVMDFGVAHDDSAATGLTQTGVLLGTPQYMSPEQARGDTRHIDRRSDVYSLGAMLYELLTGQPPFDAGSVADILVSVLDADPVPLRRFEPNLPVDLETITLKCLQKEPSQRYESAKALADDLTRYLNNEPLQARRTSMPQKLYRKARRQKLLFSLGAALILTLLGTIVSGIRNHLDRRERERLSQRQAELAERLGQEIKDMEWLLRSSRQLRLHDLEREKAIIRRRMKQIQTELLSYGPISRGLAYYALGRGHMALHEYPEALTQLQRAIELGQQSTSVHYALGFVLGKHFEQAMYEARLSGGGDWARKRLKDIEPKYLVPAIASLQAGRSMKHDAPAYLEALIAYYQRDYDTAIKQADAALAEAPWLYEAAKLVGDVYLERALQARDSGRYEEAEQAFHSAIQSYEAATAVGQSDAETYEGLAEAWVRKIEMDIRRGQPAEQAYAAAIAASDKLSVAEPHSLAGPLKKAFASMMTMSVVSGGTLSSAERVKKCLEAARLVLSRQPEHPYASDAAANCSLLAAELARSQGEDPEPLLNEAVQLLAPAVKKEPHFLWGLNDLGIAYLYLGMHKQLHGSPAAKELLEKALEQHSAAAALDSTFINATVSILSGLVQLFAEARSPEEIRALLARADLWFGRCKAINSQDQQCFNNHFQSYVRAARRIQLLGQDPQPLLAAALAGLAETRKLGGSLLDAQQHAALARLIESQELLRLAQNPAPALLALDGEVSQCLRDAPQDAMCRTLAAQAALVRVDWLVKSKQPAAAALSNALSKSILATQSKEPYPEAWQSLAETQLRLARAQNQQPKVRDAHLAEGRAAVEKLFAINSNYGMGLAVQGELSLLRAETAQDVPTRRTAAAEAERALSQAMQRDPLLTSTCAPLLRAANALTRSLGN